MIYCLIHSLINVLEVRSCRLLSALILLRKLQPIVWFYDDVHQLLCSAGGATINIIFGQDDKPRLLKRLINSRFLILFNLSIGLYAYLPLINFLLFLLFILYIDVLRLQKREYPLMYIPGDYFRQNFVRIFTIIVWWWFLA